MNDSSTSPPIGCWTKCLWCITTCGGRRINRVSPSDPIPVVSAKDKSKNNETSSKSPSLKATQTQPKCEEPVSKFLGNGHINHFFIPDDNSDDTDGHHGNLPRNEEASPHARRVSADLGSEADVHLQNSVFIEVGKERRIRVVHLKEVALQIGVQDDTISPTCSTANASTSSREDSPVKDQSKKPEDEEEDEYWFSKWTRKPRFRSIFEKNTIRSGAPEDDEESENNNAVNGNGGALSKDFETARAVAAAKRRAWAYNNGQSDNVVEQSTVVETEDEEFNSINICDSVKTTWTKSGNSTNSENTNSPTGGECSSPSSEHKDKNKMHQVEVDVQNHPSKQTTPSSEVENGFTNLAFEDNEESEPSRTESPKKLPLQGGDINTSISPPKSNTKTPGIVSEDSLTIIPLDDPEPVRPTIGSVQQPLLLFIHGISGSSEVWKSQMDFFYNMGYEIVAPDLLGHGYSSTPNNVKYYFFESLAQDLLSVYDYFVQEGRKVVVIGHGYGACLASVITRVRPKSSCLLISIAGGGPTPLISRTCCRSSLLPLYCKLFHKNKKKGRFDNPEIKNVLPSTIYDNILTGQVWNDGDSAFYRRITVPTLLVYGMKDKVVNLVEECEMERTIPKSFLEIIDTAGHMVMFDDPVKLNKMLGKFIQSWS